MALYRFKYLSGGKIKVFEVKASNTVPANNKFVNFLILNNIVQRENVLSISKNSKLDKNKKWLKQKHLTKKGKYEYPKVELDDNLNDEENPFKKKRKGKPLSDVLSSKSNHEAYNI